MTTGKKVLLGLLVALGLVGALVLALFMEQQADQAERVAAYNTLADEYRGRTYVRPDGLPASTPGEGQAAAQYRTAHGLYVESDLHRKDTLKEFYAKRRELFAAARKKSDNPSPVHYGPACTDLGFRVDMLAAGIPTQGKPSDAQKLQDQLTLRATDETLCAQLQDLGPIAQLVVEGSMQRDARSPVFLFDPWWTQTSSEAKDFAVWVFLAEAILLKARIDRWRGLGGQSLETSFAISRLSRDLSHGGGLLATMRGVAMAQSAWFHITQRLMSPALDLATAKLALAHALYLLRSPFSSADALQGEYLHSGSAAFFEDAVLRKPHGAAPQMRAADAPPAWLVTSTLGSYHDSWALMNTALDRPFAQRQALRRDIAAGHDASTNPLSGLNQLTFSAAQKYDGQIELANVRTQMLALLAAARVYQLSQRAQPDSLETLETVMGLEAHEDPLVGGKPRVRLTEKGELSISAPSMDKLKTLDIPEHYASGLELTVPPPAAQPTAPAVQPTSPPPETAH